MMSILTPALITGVVGDKLAIFDFDRFFSSAGERSFRDFSISIASSSLIEGFDSGFFGSVLIWISLPYILIHVRTRAAFLRCLLLAIQEA